MVNPFAYDNMWNIDHPVSYRRRFSYKSFVQVGNVQVNVKLVLALLVFLFNNHKFLYSCNSMDYTLDHTCGMYLCFPLLEVSLSVAW